MHTRSKNYSLYETTLSKVLQVSYVLVPTIFVPVAIPFVPFSELPAAIPVDVGFNRILEALIMASMIFKNFYRGAKSQGDGIAAEISIQNTWGTRPYFEEFRHYTLQANTLGCRLHVNIREGIIIKYVQVEITLITLSTASKFIFEYRCLPCGKI